MDLITKQLIREFNLKEFQVVSTVSLIDAGNTIPFIARYRKEQTGELSDVVLRDLYDRLNYLRNLETRKEEVIRLIEEQGKLTDELKAQIESCLTLTEVEDLYRPYKQKRKTKASIAKEKGLEPLSVIIYEQNSKTVVEEMAKSYIDEEKGVTTFEDAISGALDIIAENISDDASFRKSIREITYIEGMIISEGSKPDEKSVYEMYYNYKEPVSKVLPHRILAINRGENEEFLKVKIDSPVDKIIVILENNILKEHCDCTNYLKTSIQDAYKRLIQPSIEREIRSELTKIAEEQAIKVFSPNLKNLLLQHPIKDVVVLGFDPGFRTGCKIAVVDETGKLLATTTVYPTMPQNDIIGAKKELLGLIRKYNVNIIAIGNGTASRESETFISNMIRDEKLDAFYMIVSEAGASIYSASKLANEEYPDINVSLRGAISIARRIQDPLAELVKIEPKHIGVGQYQHDVNQTRLDDALTGVVEDAVNSVGVDLNTASSSLLQYVSGINKTIASNIVKYREENGKLKNRKELLKVARLGPAAFVQCAGFLRIPDGANPLDNTGVHPESYAATQKLLEKLGYTLNDVKAKKLSDMPDRLRSTNINILSKELDVGVPTLTDIIKELQKPGRDPRDEMPKPILRTDVLKIEDLKQDMVLAGTVRNVVDFGAFVDIGVKNDGLVHISQISQRFIKHPLDVLSVGDIVNVKVIGVDLEKGKVSLSMII